MQRLPCLSRGRFSWRLPLVASSADCLMQAFIAEGPLRISILEELVASDPAFALWAVCRLQTPTQQAAEDVESVAKQLAERGIEVLQWRDETEFLSGDGSFCGNEVWAERVKRSMAAACAARELAGDNAPTAYLLALLHDAIGWLADSGDRISVSDAQAGNSCLPAWLVRSLAEMKEQPPRSFMSRIVSQAVQAAQGQSVKPEHLRQGTLAATRWQVRIDDGSRNTTDHLPHLMQKLRRLSDLENKFDAMLEANKLDALKELAYGASHEINNPLANISTRAQTLIRDETDPERRRKLAVINSQAFRAHEMISDMMLFARPPALRLETCDLVAIVDQVIAELEDEATEQETEILRVTADEPVTAVADATHLAVAIKAVCRNSLEAIGSGGKIELFVQPAEVQPAAVEIQISDTGPGIPAEVRRHLFDPFFSGREAGRGLGFGLSKCWRIVNQHGGQVDVVSELGRGTTFTLQIPKEACPNIRTAG